MQLIIDAKRRTLRRQKRMGKRCSLLLIITAFVAAIVANIAGFFPSLSPYRSRGRDVDVGINIGGGGEGRQYACKGSHSAYPFCDLRLRTTERARDLVRRLSREEKIALVGNTSPGVPRLGIPSYEWWSEALHGLSDNGPGVRFVDGPVPAVTIFPQVILTAASFNSSLWYRIAQAVSTEARAMHNVGQAGLTFWSPNINIFRDPRWGRGQETPGEDPTVASEYAVAYVRGLQEIETLLPADDNDSDFPNRTSDGMLKVSACCKHFTAYDLESWNGYTRYTFDAVVTQQDLEDTYQPPFKSCVQNGHASCIMCSYNSVNGIPNCADKTFLTQVTRMEWGLNGYITSDCDAVAVIYEYLHYASSAEDAVADALNAGVDLNCGKYFSLYANKSIENNKVNMSSIDQALVNLFSVQVRLGMFDGDPTLQMYGKIGAESVCTDEHHELALEAARQGIVLLKNQGNTLPLSPEISKTIAVIGPNSNASTDALLGSYSGVPCRHITPLQGLEQYGSVLYQPGCKDVECSSESLISPAIEIAMEADVVILVVGLDKSQETEDLDRVDLLLPGYQQKLVLEVAKYSRGPVILVLMCGGPVDVSFARDSSQIDGIIWAGYPGQAGGKAIAEAIFGDYNPGGRLPVTWYPQGFVNVSMANMNMRPDSSRGYPGRTYRFYTGETVYPFGHGLSYTNFTCSFTYDVPRRELLLPLNSQMLPHPPPPHVQTDSIRCDNLTLNVQVRVKNHGERGGSYVVMLFWRHSVVSPERKLVKFRRIHLEAGADVDVPFHIKPCDCLTSVSEKGHKVLPLGSHVLMVDSDEYFVSFH